MKAHEQLELEMAIDQTKKMLPIYREHAKAVSQVLKSYYDELIAAGFTEAQALEIVKSHGVYTGGTPR
ncbi:hypothetical protein [Brevibacillus sp. MCWH]|uniref:hypothetical protein n=1 Tax=Brevibacillus sp. MCWH TaxID=2508871 RepID=UPI0014932932|nr:hypothetical protein [Brevibacillus sp. MCWH]NNV04633.1 hypothetical protein [Brevibacillus sp. MCWH]